MKTSVIEVRDMLSVLSVLGVEKRIGAVPGVESVTVNFAAGNATVRYDETRLQATDIKAAVHQSGDESAGESEPKPASEHKPADKPAAVPKQDSAPASAITPEATVPKAATGVPAAKGHENHPATGAQISTPEADTPKASAAPPAVAPPPAAPAVGAVPDAKPSTPVAATAKAVPVVPAAAPAVGGHQDHATPYVKPPTPPTPVTTAPKAAPVAPVPATRAVDAATDAKSSTPTTAEPKAGSWKVNALSLATTLGLAYISCAIFDLLFPPFGLLAALAPASPMPISGSPLGFLLGFAMFTVAGLVLGALYGAASQFWSNRLR